MLRILGSKTFLKKKDKNINLCKILFFIKHETFLVKNRSQLIKQVDLYTGTEFYRANNNVS